MIALFFSSIFSLKFFIKNGWVIVFVVMACALSFQDFHNKSELAAALSKKITFLEKEKVEALLKNQELSFRKQRHLNKDQVELILKERLGVVAEDEVKVVFMP